jgi:hypothetical protein
VKGDVVVTVTVQSDGRMGVHANVPPPICLALLDLAKDSVKDLMRGVRGGANVATVAAPAPGLGGLIARKVDR